eukprot:5271210-Amphidinium_carterae.1
MGREPLDSLQKLHRVFLGVKLAVEKTQTDSIQQQVQQTELCTGPEPCISTNASRAAVAGRRTRGLQQLLWGRVVRVRTPRHVAAVCSFNLTGLLPGNSMTLHRDSVTLWQGQAFAFMRLSSTWLILSLHLAVLTELGGGLIRLEEVALKA